MTTHSTKGGKIQNTASSAVSQRSSFVVMALDMSWRLAVAVLVPVLAGVKLDKIFGTTYVCTLSGLALALVTSTLVMRRAVRMANRLPVPKLTAAQKRAIRKSYQDEDADD